MRHTIYLLLVILTVVLGGCDKVPINGELDGQWQLMEVQRSDGVRSTKNEQIYWAFQLHLMSIRKSRGVALNDSLTGETIARFRCTVDSLLCEAFYKHSRSEDVLLDNPHTQVLSSVGIIGNTARFAIERLTATELRLRSSYARLTFRKF